MPSLAWRFSIPDDPDQVKVPDNQKCVGFDAYGKWCIEETERIIEREGPETIGAIFTEPVQGAGGVIVPPPGYLGKLRALAREYGILFVADEVITAFGRRGARFARPNFPFDDDH